jgi:23S rRNA pseudouridine1911/1915/1917 synthase
MSHPQKFIVDELKTRLDKFLAMRMEKVSRSAIQKDIEEGKVLVNNEVVREGKHAVRLDDTIEYRYEESQEPEPKDIPIHTLYNNHGLLIIDKPPGIAVHPGSGFTGDSLTQGLLYHFKGIKVVGEDGRPGIVHRLDKDTSGVMLVALDQDMYEHLKDAFAQRKVKKYYLALVRGRVEPSHRVIDVPIGKSKRDFRKYTTENMIEAKPATTEYWVLEHLGGTGSYLDEYTLIKVQLHTGRTHQIRVHFSSLGHSLLGDPLYGTKKNSVKGLDRQFLHASSIEVALPSGEWIEAQSKLPQDLRSVLLKLGSKVVNQF